MVPTSSWLQSKKTVEEVAALRRQMLMLTPATFPTTRRAVGIAPLLGDTFSLLSSVKFTSAPNLITLASCGNHFLQICVLPLLHVKAAGTWAGEVVSSLDSFHRKCIYQSSQETRLW